MSFGACAFFRMRHRPFPKLAAERDPQGPLPGGPWVALEKLHGAQLQIAVGDGAPRFGKRKAWLAGDEPFFGWQLARQDLAEAARRVHAELGAPRVVLYGELFGGSYPHPAVAAAPGMQPVQTGIWYAPDLRWAVFDVLVAADDDDPGELLAHREVESLAAAAGLLVPPLVHRGPRGQCDAAPVRFATRVPALLGLPALADNLAEGLVLKPDARAPAGARPGYKRKIAEFDEQRFGESEAWDPDQRIDVAALSRWAARLVNPPRIASAASKWGRDDRERLLEEIELDVMVDLAEAFPAAFAALSAADESALRAEIRAAAAPLLA